MASKKTSSKTSLPPVAASRLKPFIERGIANGIFNDEKPVVEMFKNKANDPELKETLSALGGLKSEVGQAFLTDIVLTDLTSILRQKRYTAHMKVWEVSHNTVGAASGNPRPVCNIFGQVVIEDGDESLEPALFAMSLWDTDASIGDDVEVDGTYVASVSCKNLDLAVLDLRPLSGLTSFNTEDYEHGDGPELLRETYEVTPIADLEDNISRGRADYRLVEATVSFSGVQNSRAGNQFGKMLLKDESTMTLDAIESGENLLLNCICSTDIATRFGKYSRILALVTTKVQGEWGLSANVVAAIPVILVAPPKAEAAVSNEKEDDAASYFKQAQTIDLDDEDDDEPEATTESTESTESTDDGWVEEDDDDDDDQAEEAAEAPAKTDDSTDDADDGDEEDDGWEDWD